MSVEIKKALKSDVPAILEFIKGLAEYEKLAHEVVATEEDLEKTLFGDKSHAEVLFIEENGTKVGFALFFHSYSTFLAKNGIYLEDLYIKPEYRGRGYGKKMFIHLAALAVERRCGRFEWSVLDWNTPAIEFYQSMGSVPMSEWTMHRLTGPALLQVASQGSSASD